MRRGLVALVLLTCCSPRVPPAPAVHYTVGPPYELGGTWWYPRESFQYDQTGLAERSEARSGLTADGEVRGADGMTAAHRTLQLPAIATVTNLDTGRQVRLRLNDRGPARPGRLIGLGLEAASLLGVPSGGTAPVRVQVDSDASQALRDMLGSGPPGVTAAPVGAVRSEALPAPGGRSTTVSTSDAAETVPTRGAAPDRNLLAPLPAVATQGAAQPGGLWLFAGRFSGERYANQVRSRLSALPVEVRREGGARRAEYVVMVGPFSGVAQADAALDQAQAAGVTDAAIVVE